MNLEPLSPRQKWRAITLATLLLVPAYWSLLAGIVASASAHPENGPNPAAALAFGLAIVPFVFIVLAFMTEQPRASTAALKAMGLAVVVGVPVSALAGDAVTGIVAGLGAGGIAAIRCDASQGPSWKGRAIAVVMTVVYPFVLVRAAYALALLPAPIFPFTAIGIADQYAEAKHANASQAVPEGRPVT